PNCLCQLDHETTFYNEFVMTCQNCGFHKKYDVDNIYKLFEKTNKEIDRRIRLKVAESGVKE
ncbi:unnamed protein product, partial [marine sediment metagenome]